MTSALDNGDGRLPARRINMGSLVKWLSEGAASDEYTAEPIRLLSICQYMTTHVTTLFTQYHIVRARMSSPGYNKKIQFRAGAEKDAAEVLNNVHMGGINTSELAREGLIEMLRRITTDEDKIAIYEQYSRGEISEDIARTLLGDELDHMAEERRDFEQATQLDTDQFFQE
ncbi:hypothetical protein GCM10009000_078690 [Halobacterium noricense]|uniref:Uncharacterized protein n=2 Tax=Haladaptatus pallidirubidus TaxID=1008152 RepID=A0AAV3UHG6_9EURY